MDDMFDPLTDEEQKTAKGTFSPASESKAIAPVPEDAFHEIPPYRLGEPEKVWEYRDADGRILFKVCRFALPNGGKEDRPLTYRMFPDGSCHWAWKGLDAPRPLYGLDRLFNRPDAPVIVCEGEKTADAAEVLFPQYVAVTSPNGARSAHKANWRALAGRRVIIWPDHDETGQEYSKNVARLLTKAGVLSLSIVTVPDFFPSKWDLADPLPEGWTHNDLVQLLNQAVSLKLPRKIVKQDTQTDALIALSNETSLFHTPDQKAYADITVNGHRETWPLRSKRFKSWLIRRFYEERQKGPSNDSLNNALSTIEARAVYDGPERQIFVRVAQDGETIYLDLCNDSWQVVEITIDGWRVIASPPVRFQRTLGMSALPVPEKGHSIETLRAFLNVKADSDFVLVVSWILAALCPSGPYPLLGLSGEQGSSKSTLLSFLKKIIDPNEVPLRPLPREERDLFIAAGNGHVLAFDNLSEISPWLSDALCRLSTGGGFATRQLFSDQEETLIKAMRPMALNGIGNVISRPDLADRSLILNLAPISDERRKPEKELYDDFEKALPSILGALLDGLTHGLKTLPHTRLDKLPRMADFALWGTACEGAFWPPGTFMKAYTANQDDVIQTVIHDSLLSSALYSFMKDRAEWTGTSTELLGLLNSQVEESTRKQKEWPKAPNVLSGRLVRDTTFLRKAGIEISRSKSGTRNITISRKTG